MSGTPGRLPHLASPHLRPPFLAIVLAFTLALAPSGAVRADWLSPDPSLREAQMSLRDALRDTIGHAGDADRLTSLAAALLKLGRLEEAGPLYRRVLDLRPNDLAALAALGKISLFEDRLAEAESLLARPAQAQDPGALADLLAAHYRASEWAAAAELASRVPGQEGREEKLRALAAEGAYRIQWSADRTETRFTRIHPVPLVRVRLNGKLVILALDTGAGEMILDPAAARRVGARIYSGKSQTFWSGRRVAVGEAVVQRFELGSVRVDQVPSQLYPMRSYSLVVNPQAPPVDGVLGLEALRRLNATLDYPRFRLELHREPDIPSGAVELPIQLWGEHEVMVRGSINASRPLAMVVASGIPDCGVASSREVFEEIGVRPGAFSRMMRSTGRLMGGQEWSQVSVNSVTVGPVTSGRLPGWSGALEPLELWWHGVRRDALLSHEFLRHYRVTFDWSRRALVLQGRF